MKTICLLALLVFTFSLSGFTAENSGIPKLKTVPERPLVSPKTEKEKATLRHVVALKFKEGTSDEEIKKVEAAFRDLKKKIPQIAALEWGTNNSPEKHAKGFTHCFILTFNSEKDRDVYLPHPDHKAFGKILGPVMADVFVIDYWAKE